MKNALAVLTLVFSVGSFAQSTGGKIVASTTQVTLSPFATATELLKSATATIVSPFASTSVSVQARGVAGKEQIKDELVALNDDMEAGKVQAIEQVRQPALRELFAEIAADEKQMSEINSVLESGTVLEKIATAVTYELMVE